MKRMVRFSILEMMVVIAIILILMSMIMPILALIKDRALKLKATTACLNIGLSMVAYAEDDLKGFKMPYPLAKGKEKNWGTDKDCLSTDVIEMLFEQNFLKKGEEGQLVSPGAISPNYVPMKLENKLPLGADGHPKAWKIDSRLDFQVYCHKNLSSNIGGKVILVGSYDNADIRNCQFNGTGWVFFYADKSVGFFKRKNLKNYDMEAGGAPTTDPAVPAASVNIETIDKASITSFVPAGVPGTWMAGAKGGGSTELMGKRDTDSIFKALVRD